jgi:putative inorganic carbon (hco3(-)) transporter
MIMPLLLVSAQNVDLVYQGKLLKWIRSGLYSATALCAFTVIGTYSRGGFLALSAALLVYILLQKRRFTALAGCAAAVTIFLAVVPIPQRYYERLSTIKSYDSNRGEDVEGARESAQSRPHFWRVGLLMVAAHPLGVGLKQYEAAYDLFDFSFGRYGHHRAVHNSHVQVLAELGYFGLTVWIGLWAYAYFACMRIRWRSRAAHLSPEHQRLFLTMANGLLTSMTGFIVGGSFLSLAYNDLTWLTFGMVAGLDRLSARLSEAPAAEAVPEIGVSVPIAFRAVTSYATIDAGGRP